MSTLAATNLKNPSSGSNNIVLATDGSTTITTLNGTTITGTSVRGVITSGTAVASTSGTAIDFTGIPSWVKRVTVMFNGVSTNGTSNYQVQIGSGSVSTSGYVGGINNHTGANGSNFSAGFLFFNALTATCLASGSMTLTLQTGNTWVEQSMLTNSAAAGDMRYSAGYVALSGTLDRVRITTVNGTDTFDAGSINILYEG